MRSSELVRKKERITVIIIEPRTLFMGLFQLHGWISASIRNMMDSFGVRSTLMRVYSFFCQLAMIQICWRWLFNRCVTPYRWNLVTYLYSYTQTWYLMWTQCPWLVPSYARYPVINRLQKWGWRVGLVHVGFPVIYRSWC